MQLKHVFYENIVQEFHYFPCNGI